MSMLSHSVPNFNRSSVLPGGGASHGCGRLPFYATQVAVGIHIAVSNSEEEEEDGGPHNELHVIKRIDTTDGLVQAGLEGNEDERGDKALGLGQDVVFVPTALRPR